MYCHQSAGQIDLFQLPLVTDTSCEKGIQINPLSSVNLPRTLDLAVFCLVCQITDVVKTNATIAVDDTLLTSILPTVFCLLLIFASYVLISVKY